MTFDSSRIIPKITGVLRPVRPFITILPQCEIKSPANDKSLAPNRMIPRFHLVPVFGGAAALCFAFGTTSAVAGEKCAAYGPGFTAVEGSETCIRVGGHVRVETGTGNLGSSANTGWASNGARPASLHSSSDDTSRLGPVNGVDFPRAHLRLPQGAIGYADPQ
jgi:hypothetical protein